MNVQHRAVDGPLGAIISNNLSQGSTSIIDQSVKKKRKLGLILMSCTAQI